MAGSTISGNAGSSAVGVQIQCVPLTSANGTQIQIADGIVIIVPVAANTPTVET